MYKNTDKINHKLHHFFDAFFIFTIIFSKNTKKCCIAQHFFVLYVMINFFRQVQGDDCSPLPLRVDRHPIFCPITELHPLINIV